MRTDVPTFLPTITVDVIDHIEAGRRIRKLRKKRGVSLRNFAKWMGYSAPFISDLERGRRNWTDANFFLAVKILNTK